VISRAGLLTVLLTVSKSCQTGSCEFKFFERIATGLRITGRDPRRLWERFLTGIWSAQFFFELNTPAFMEDKIFLSREALEKMAEEVAYDAGKVAEVYGLSVRQLQRLFQSSHGCSPQKWMNDLKVFRAQERLLLGQSVKQIASEMGYRDVSYFCQQFKRLCGMTPSRFRELKFSAREQA